MMGEYPRQAPDGDPMDFVEVSELHDGLILHHCDDGGLVRCAGATNGWVSQVTGEIPIDRSTSRKDWARGSNIGPPGGADGGTIEKSG